MTRMCPGELNLQEAGWNGGLEWTTKSEKPFEKRVLQMVIVELKKKNIG